jgi:hydrogenase maturation protein HypF
VQAFVPQELQVLEQMVKQKINSPMTSSMGRLFDGIASMLGLCHQASFEGQAAMALEFQALENLALAGYCYKINSGCIDLSGIIQGVIEDIRAGRDVKGISTRFHQTLVEIIVDVARDFGRADIVLTGGCFQNRWLIQNAVGRLKQEGFRPYWHKQVPTNDAGISLGQMFVAARSKDVSGHTGKN